MLKGKNWLQWSVLVVLGVFMLFAGGCGGGGGDTPVVTPPPPPSPPRPEPQGNWQDEGNYDTGWYAVKPYEISTAKELAGLAKLVNDGNTFEGETISITADIDLQDHYWTPISNHNFATPFRAIFDGQGNTISNIAISIEETNRLAIIGFVGNNNGTVTNVRLTDVSISGANDDIVWVGGLVGWNYGTITDCTVGDSYISVSVSISASGYGCAAGGLVGANEGTITGCKASNSTVSATDSLSGIAVYAGGLIGQTEKGGTITNCVASGGKVTATASNSIDRIGLGGFIGLVDGDSGSLSGNTTTITELPAIGRDSRLSPPAPSNDI
jgi:hypothetical protein